MCFLETRVEMTPRSIAPRNLQSPDQDGVFLMGLEPQINDSENLASSEILARSGHNLGNLVFHFALAKQLKFSERRVSWWEDPSVISLQGDIGVLAGANQAGAHWDAGELAGKFRLLNCRLVMVGLGAQSPTRQILPNIPTRTLEWFVEIAARTQHGVRNIGVRGDFSRSVLEHYGLSESIEVVGCPSLFISPLPNLGQHIQARADTIDRIAVVAGHTGWPHLKLIEQSLVRLVAQSDGSYIAQSDEDLIQLCRGEAEKLDPAVLERCRLYLAPDLGDSAFINWANRYGRLFTDVERWMEHLRQFDFVIGTRYHGVALGIQAGIPGLVIAHDSRTIELCVTTGVPYRLASNFPEEINVPDLIEIAAFDATQFDQNRRNRARRYLRFMDSNEVEMLDWVRELGN